MNTNRIDTKELIKILKMTQPKLKDYTDLQLRKYGYKPVYMDGFLYAEGDFPVGLVAHMDTVYAPPKYVKYQNGVMEGDKGLGADDRAGVYGILHLIKRGLRPSVLLMEDEEKGCIGADKFVKADIRMNLNYLIELDRQGADDSVFYDCDNPEFEKFVNSFCFKMAYGSFSDISVIAPHYGIAAVNLSVGYYGQHTKYEILVISELSQTLRKVERMLSVEAEKFVYVPYDYSFKKYSKTYKNGESYRSWDYGYYWKDQDDYAYGTTPDKSKGTEYTVDYSDMVELYKCILVRATGELIEVDSVGEYFIDPNDQVFNSYGEWVDAYVTDYNLERYLSYADFC